MWVSESVRSSFKSREQKMLQIINNIKIDYISIGIFGSYSRDEFTARSDIDMCIVVNQLPTRSIKGWLYEEADMLGIDLIFVTNNYFNNDKSRFAINLRKDFKEVLRC